MGKRKQDEEQFEGASIRKENLVRSSGFEPPRYFYRQPLKLVRLPIPPRPRRELTSRTKFAKLQGGLRDSPTRGIDFATSLAPDSEWAPAAAELARVAELAPEQAG